MFLLSFIVIYTHGLFIHTETSTMLNCLQTEILINAPGQRKLIFSILWTLSKFLRIKSTGFHFINMIIVFETTCSLSMSKSQFFPCRTKC
eukprot:UN05897